MSYRNNQFYYPISAGEELGGTNGTNGIPAADNPGFSYPDNSVRTDYNGSLISRNLQRGYIRSLLTEAQGVQVPIKKCRFQFNPAHLMQAVSMNSSMLNFFMQDPAQLAQPVASEVTFGFEVFFDRSMELNNPTKGSFSGDPTNPWATSDPSEVGVLRDIAAFYAVIGQGISSDQAEYAKAQYTNSLNAEFNIAEGAVEEADRSKALANLNEYVDNVNVNVGNTAFLLPLPVRVMFSSLYMVEGYVTNTTVVYTKFTSTMVPMQATMTISMRALYIGFAKKDTFLTENIKKTIEAERFATQQAADQQASSKDALLAVTKELALLEYQLVETNSRSTAQANTFNPMSLSEALYTTARFVNLSMVAPNAVEGGGITELLRSSLSVSIQFELTLKVFGPFDNLGQIGTNGQSRDGYVQSLLSVTVKSDTITTVDDWNDVVKNRFAGEGSTPRRTTVGSINGSADLPFDKYYSVVVDGSASITLNDTKVRADVARTVTKGLGSDSAFFDSELSGRAALMWESAIDGFTGDLPNISDSGSPAVNLWNDVLDAAGRVRDTVLPNSGGLVSSVGDD